MMRATVRYRDGTENYVAVEGKHGIILRDNRGLEHFLGDWEDLDAITAQMVVDRDLTGKVGVCSKGRPGFITGRKVLPWGESWVGIGLDDGTAWASREPRVLTDAEVVALSESKVSSA